MIGVIDVGGGLRGVYGAGVFDFCLDNHIEFDYCIGVSAGSANIAAYLAGQRGANYKYYTEYGFRPEYMSRKNFLKTGNYLDLDYIYGTLMNSDGEAPLDYEALIASGKQFYIVATDADTGKPVYFDVYDMNKDDYGPIKASSCVPGLNLPYFYRGHHYYDGGISDPIPLKKALDDGCDKIVLILTRPKDYIRLSPKDWLMARPFRHRYPKAVAVWRNRSLTYNSQLEFARALEKQGKVLIVSPENIEGMSTLTKDKNAIIDMYHKGLRDAAAILNFI